jgi:ethanolamine utilization protein EutA
MMADDDDLMFDDTQLDDARQKALEELIWASDNVELATVGIDIGSSTSHLMFAKVHMQRLATALSSRFVVVGREVVWRSPILLTPYRPDYTIDAEALGKFIHEGYEAAGIPRDAIDSGAVILTGEALKRHNARAIADIFSADAGKFVCASAGHHMECLMAAHGSGAVKLSRERAANVLNVDIGGGTTKFALISNGHMTQTAAIAVGGRLLVTDAAGTLTRLEEPVVVLAKSLGITLTEGGNLSAADRARIVTKMVELLVGMAERRAPDALAKALLVTDSWHGEAGALPIDLVTFSGGVAEFLYGRESASFGDLGAELARELRTALDKSGLAAKLHDPGQGIRATVIGAAQFSVQVSGNTILISHPERLPVRNLPVLICKFGLGEVIDQAEVTGAVKKAIAASDLVEGEGPVALSFPWAGTPDYPRFAAVAHGLAAALPQTLAIGHAIVLLIDGDVGMTLGRIITNEVAPGADLIAIDGVQLKEFDYVDIGTLIQPADVVPVIIKSLLF